MGKLSKINNYTSRHKSGPYRNIQFYDKRILFHVAVKEKNRSMETRQKKTEIMENLHINLVKNNNKERKKTSISDISDIKLLYNELSHMKNLPILLKFWFEECKIWIQKGKYCTEDILLKLCRNYCTENVQLYRKCIDFRRYQGTRIVQPTHKCNSAENCVGLYATR